MGVVLGHVLLCGYSNGLHMVNGENYDIDTSRMLGFSVLGRAPAGGAETQLPRHSSWLVPNNQHNMVAFVPLVMKKITEGFGCLVEAPGPILCLCLRQGAS